MVALTNPMTRAAMRASTNPLTYMPGMRRATIQTARALRSQLSRRRIGELYQENKIFNTASHGVCTEDHGVGLVLR